MRLVKVRNINHGDFGKLGVDMNTRARFLFVDIFRFLRKGSKLFYICQQFLHSLILLTFTALLPFMVRRRSGHIVVISSVQGKIAIPYRSACKLSFLI